MPRLDRYILKLMLTLFGFFALVLVAVYWVNRAVNLFEDLISDGQTALVVLEFTALTLPLVISVALPVAAFAASAYGANRLSGESELVAMQAAGMSPWRLARPVLYFGLVVGLMVAVLAHALVPMARARLNARQAELAENIGAQFLRDGQFMYPGDNITLFIRDTAPNGELIGLFLEDASDPSTQITYTAARAALVKLETGPRLVMVNGMAQTMRNGPDGPHLSVTRFGDFSYDLGRILTPGRSKGRDLRDYATQRLLNPDAALLAATGATPAAARLQAHERIAQPLLAPVAAMLGFATLMLGGFSRFGVWRQLAAAIFGLILLQLLVNAAANQAGADPAKWPLVYAPALLGAAGCAVILWLSGRRRRIRPGPSAEARI